MIYIVSSYDLLSRKVDIWTKEKLDYLRRYIYSFTTALRNKFEELNYIDLFCGPGKNYIEEDDIYIDGSPIIALKTENPFNNYIFNDNDEKVIFSLKKRTERFEANIHFLNNDCNQTIDEISNIVNPKSRNLLFIDPTGIDLNFITLKLLSEKVITDILMLFPFGIGIKRNARNMIESGSIKLLRFLGIEDIDELMELLEIENDNLSILNDKEELNRKILDLYINQLSRINYDKVSKPDFVAITNKNNVIMYHLIFASKNTLGHKIWRSIKSKRANGQRELGL